MLKITPTPWKCQDTPHDPDFTHDIFANDYTGIASIHLADELGAQDAEAIVSAINNTYGKGYDPAKMAQALEAIKYSPEDTGRKGCTWRGTEYDSESVAYGYNLALEHFKKLVNESKL